ncbi:MAG: hypothetical protein COB30_012685 [Ectothiorhodospiraceae bacterium]|nr:hypothetical protein [Ectothiorhodospiraceae bacterium]
MDKQKISRRQFLTKIAQTSALGFTAVNAPYVLSKKTSTVRVMGTHVTLQEELRKKAMQDLGIRLEFEPKGSAVVLQKAASSPESFDLYEQWSDSINILWQAGAIQPIDIEKLTYWNEINSLTKTGKIANNARIGKGDAL